MSALQLFLQSLDTRHWRNFTCIMQCCVIFPKNNIIALSVLHGEFLKCQFVNNFTMRMNMKLTFENSYQLPMSLLKTVQRQMEVCLCYMHGFYDCACVCMRV